MCCFCVILSLLICRRKCLFTKFLLLSSLLLSLTRSNTPVCSTWQKSTSYSSDSWTAKSGRWGGWFWLKRRGMKQPRERKTPLCVLKTLLLWISFKTSPRNTVLIYFVKSSANWNQCFATDLYEHFVQLHTSVDHMH